MRRPLTIRKWMRKRPGHPWKFEGACTGYLKLPWVGEERGEDENPRIPDKEVLAKMTKICDSCPVIGDCAVYALSGDDGRGIAGGFYAGVWIPWLSSNSDSKYLRQRARVHLRSLLKLVTSIR